MALFHPKVIAFDSSTLGDLVRDVNDATSEHHNSAKNITDHIYSGDFYPVLTIHHLAEMLQHDNEKKVALRLEFLSRIPFLMTLRSTPGKASQVGSVFHVFAAEVRAFLSQREGNLKSTADSARDELFKVTSGAIAVQPFEQFRKDFPSALADLRREAIYAASITHFSLPAHRKLSVRDAISGAIGFRKDTERAISELAEQTAAGLEQHADKKMLDRESAAKRFAQSMSREFTELARTDEPVLDGLCRVSGIDIRAVNLDGSVEDFCWMATYQQILDRVSTLLRVPRRLTEFDVPSGKIPSWIIRRELARSRSSTPRAAGSDLNDECLAALGCYADVTVVDKRTLNYLKQATHRFPELRACIRSVIRAKNISDLLRQIQI